ncbi:Crp/Fnr family transcriptional regulator [Elizabethkingia anophelis]|uniref:Crp/Fnr family transcriptional regulator n=1 Tax=Elizabethkingia anophelis TaxID=1117645 RepID=A0AAU8UYJ9_9FLAO|nr:Crp/Fnr family transcriptional regulator [Elizabethkingia anophelis]AQX02257.1 Crp/Fnr family transcriptional regulator [Elizabethkingia anophelis]OPB63777.1 Crp/Fnr family transcriptional regulator [Elizabethkingia anophelis]
MKNNESTVLFKQSPGLVEDLHEHSIKKQYSKGSIIVKESSYANSVLFVNRGLLKVSCSREGEKDVLLYYIKAGELSVLSFLGGIQGEKSLVNIESEKDSEIFFLPINQAAYFMRKYPLWWDYVLKMFMVRYEDLLNAVTSLSLKRIDERLLDLLESKARLSQSNTVKITHQQLADELVTAREVVSRLLKQLAQEEVLKMGRSKITLL